LRVVADGRGILSPGGASPELAERLRAALRSARAAGLRSAIATGLVLLVGLLVLEGVCTWWASRGSVWAEAVAFVFTGLIGMLCAVYVIGVRAVGRAVIVGNEKSRLGALVLDLVVSSIKTGTDRGRLLVGPDNADQATDRVRAATAQLSAQVGGNPVTRRATRAVLRLATRLVGQKVVDSLIANNGDIDATSRELAASADTWLSSMVTTWVRTHTIVACGIPVVLSVVVAALLSTT
jgi:hypothetical protein